MRRTTGIVLAVTLAVALGMWMTFSSNRSTMPPAVGTASPPIAPIELMKKSDRGLPDRTVREPF
jgi:hypothetical protein